MDGRAHAHDLVRVHTLVGLLAEELLDHFLDLGDPRRPPDQNHLVDGRRLDPGVLERLFHRRKRPLDQIVDQLLELRSRERIIEMLGPVLGRSDEGQVDVGLLRRRKLHLGFFRRLLQALERHRVLGKVDPLVLLEFLDQPVDDLLVEVVAAQVRIPVGRLHLEDAVTQLEDGNVVCATTEVEYGDLLVGLFFEPVGQSGRGGLVDDAKYLQARDLSCVFGGLALGIVEVGRNRDDGLFDLLAQVVLGGLFHLLKDHRRDLGGRERLVRVRDLDFHASLGVGLDRVGNEFLFRGYLVALAAHEPLDREDRVLRIGDRLAAGHLAHEPLTVLGERHHGRCGPAALGVGNHNRLTTLHDRHDRVGSPQIDPDNLSHVRSSTAPRPLWPRSLYDGPA